MAASLVELLVLNESISLRTRAEEQPTVRGKSSKDEWPDASRNFWPECRHAIALATDKVSTRSHRMLRGHCKYVHGAQRDARYGPARADRSEIMRILVGLRMLCLGVQFAGATGGMSCTIDDPSLKLELGSGLGRRIGADLFNFRAELEIRMATIPPDFRALQMDRAALVQSWLDREELKLDLYLERVTTPHGYIELAIQTRNIEEGTYVGRYVLTIYDTDDKLDVEPRTLEARGEVKCLVE
jgi:hypothetical protein